MAAACVRRGVESEAALEKEMGSLKSEEEGAASSTQSMGSLRMRGRASGGRGAVGAEARDDVAGRQGKAQMKKGGKKDSAGSSEQSLSDGSGAGSSFPFEKSGRNDGSSVSGGNLSGDDRESSVGADCESNLSDGGSSGPSRGGRSGRSDRTLRTDARGGRASLSKARGEEEKFCATASSESGSESGVSAKTGSDRREAKVRRRKEMGAGASKEVSSTSASGSDSEESAKTGRSRARKRRRGGVGEGGDVDDRVASSMNVVLAAFAVGQKKPELIQRASKELLGILGAMALAPNMAVTPENVSGVADVVEKDVRAAASYAKRKLRNGPDKVQKDFKELSWNELSALVKVIQSLMAWVKRKGSGGTEVRGGVGVGVDAEVNKAQKARVEAIEKYEAVQGRGFPKADVLSTTAWIHIKKHVGVVGVPDPHEVNIRKYAPKYKSTTPHSQEEMTEEATLGEGLLVSKVAAPKMEEIKTSMQAHRLLARVLRNWILLKPEEDDSDEKSMVTRLDKLLEKTNEMIGHTQNLRADPEVALSYVESVVSAVYDSMQDKKYSLGKAMRKATSRAEGLKLAAMVQGGSGQRSGSKGGKPKGGDGDGERKRGSGARGGRGGRRGGGRWERGSGRDGGHARRDDEGGRGEAGSA